jgi:tRNA-dihydrouridine synthase B
MFRKHAHTYSKGYQGASKLRNEVNRIDDADVLREVLDRFFKEGKMVA